MPWEYFTQKLSCSSYVVMLFGCRSKKISLKSGGILSRLTVYGMCMYVGELCSINSYLYSWAQHDPFQVHEPWPKKFVLVHVKRSFLYDNLIHVLSIVLNSPSNVAPN